MANKRIISQKYLQGKSKYVYCPFCVKKAEEEGIDWKEKLFPLRYVVTAEPIQNKDGTYWDYIDTHYECSKCGNTNITVKTFMIFYCERYDGARFNEPPKEPFMRWNAEKNKMVPSRWNQAERKWEEILDKAE
ncbi:MAG: hypothetical protein J6O99_08155 [Methanobrevibacter sp.]|nr:hypothetical protein [Methanobrevibacter sp.]